MDRREWMKYCSVVSGGAALSALGTNKLMAMPISANAPSTEIEEIHIINFSHTDFGYTDLPSSTWDYHVNNIRLAMKYIEETKNYPQEARFKWTLEALWILERFWEGATPEEKKKFDTYVSEGLIEVTAMPGNLTCSFGSYEWKMEMDRLSGFLKKYDVVSAMQGDVNGLQYGLIESLLNRGVKQMVMGLNTYNGGNPMPTPSFFWWEGISGKKLLINNTESYSCYDYFNAAEWRRGPVPNRYDVWFNPPTGNDIFSSRKEDILATFERLKPRLENLKKNGYSHRLLQLSVTNNWTIDNDQPCRQLSEFVKTWNEMGLKPKLVLTTPKSFLRQITPELSQNISTVKGDWCDWWADGIASAPFELSVLQAAKRRNMDIGNALVYLKNKDASLDKQIKQLSRDLLFSAEHTWASYDSVPRPYSERTVGTQYQKFEIVLRASEDSKRIQADIIRQSERFRPLTRTNFIEVLNPGKEGRSGWVELSARAFRTAANGVREASSGQFYPFEQTLASEWAGSNGSSVPPADFPNDVWPYFPEKYRFYLENLEPGASKRFELVNETNDLKKTVKSSKFFKVETDQFGSVKNVVFTPLNKLIFDENSEYRPAQLIIERPREKYSRDAIAYRTLKKKDIDYSSLKVTESSSKESFYAQRFSTVLEEPFAKRVEQQWDIMENIPRIEITTTIWLNENIDPLAVYIAFPFNLNAPKAFYDALGTEVQVGVGQMPNSCGEYQNVHNGVSYRSSEMNLAISTLDCPLAIFESIQRGSKRTAFSPKNGHFFNMICQNYWTTNFTILYPTKLVVKHIIDFGKPGENLLPIKGNELWAYPSI